MKLEVHLTGVAGTKAHVVELEKEGERLSVLLNGQEVAVDVVQVAPNTISILLGGKSFEIHVTPTIDGNLRLQTGPEEFTAEVQDPRAWRGRKHGPQEAEGRQQIASPMPGKVIRVIVKAGDEVEAGQGLIVVEAMKMQNEIRSPKKGKVERVLAKEGQNVNAGEILAWVE
jgi:biotin carboxyl carrier protein